ncbi:MAG: ABC transporter substrate-binding protein [Ilumatobacteraceae bacterium]
MKKLSTRRRFVASELVAIVLVISTATGLMTSAASATTPFTGPSRSGSVNTIRISGGEYGIPTPYAYVRGPGLAMALLAFDTLLWKDAFGKVVPWLADSWTTSKDRLSWSFKLNQKAKWQDGQDVTAEDVVFTFDYNLKGAGKKAPGISGGIDFIKSVVAVDSDTVQFNLSRVYSPFDILVAGRIPIVPKHIWSTVTDPAKFINGNAMIGSGPYKVAAYDAVAGNYKFTANTSFYLGTPYVKNIEMVSAKGLVAIRKGEIDTGASVLEEGVPDKTYDRFRNDPKKWGILEAPGEWTRALHINMKKGFPYSDARFRQALAYAIDRKDMVKRLLLGNGEVGSMGGLAPSHPNLAPGLPTYDLDVKKSGKLLDAVGLVDLNGDGYRDLPGGASFVPTLQTSSRFSPRAATLIATYLKKVGIKVSIASFDSATADANAAKANYELALIGYGGLGGDPDGLRTRFSANVKSLSFARVHGWVNRTFEAAAAQQLVALTRPARKVQVNIMQREIAKDVAVISLYVPTRVQPYNKQKFDAWYFTPGGLFGGYPGTINKDIFFSGMARGK